MFLYRDKDGEIEPGLMDLIRRLKKNSTDLFSPKKVYWTEQNTEFIRHACSQMAEYTLWK